MPNQYDRPECAIAYSRALDAGTLYLAHPPVDTQVLYLAHPPVVAWFSERGGVTARLTIEGTPRNAAGDRGIEAFISLQLTPLIPLLSAALVWDGARILGIDMGGDPHRNVRGRPIYPPHRHFYRPDGKFETEPLDWARAGVESVDDHQGAFRHFLDWCGLGTHGVQWQDPPALQRALISGVSPRFGWGRRIRS